MCDGSVWWVLVMCDTLPLWACETQQTGNDQYSVGKPVVMTLIIYEWLCSEQLTEVVGRLGERRQLIHGVCLWEALSNLLQTLRHYWLTYEYMCVQWLRNMETLGSGEKQWNSVARGKSVPNVSDMAFYTFGRHYYHLNLLTIIIRGKLVW